MTLKLFNAEQLVHYKHFLKTKKARYFFGGLVFILLLVFTIQLFRFINNSQIYSALDNYHTFKPAQIDSDRTLMQANKLIELPNDQNGSVGKIKDVKSLSQKKDFFKKARNGQYLIIYPDMTIIYDADNKSVVDIARGNLLQ